ncbi:UDP-4-amino-4,6-dideoxy-N-acetyl-beta-L-altrosamine transaminase [Calothrix sp. FACHB-1219]|uniref:UDP-4-amino-4, 6-dideoxy-N-acetyl-beta-L-altrosamine transaminase n=1 Tax=unclassified Calothrix TaxID=2619626 RepID=UPI00168997C1|nr:MULTISPECIES: UDP-4-amino-4,6-dideoxy-N-acetyl-beta-L-altrosamine transaminase [unclassified Calothrix]MBD2201239.1 UDP-4-amino-4,6-dideoxy-N-acetyl-beta-L-altrosamine transaminase [Calothrix sp. FACHB-168]MBD2215673.1 UDP-4-amino-4,6-dideoxy-N-acetyl-beta-L-altrosamine transaminase [Calothrix sp. FACHB-1219]
MNDYIPYGRQHISQEDIDAVIAVLQSDWITQGPAIERFEQAVANYCGAKYAVAVSSATAALHIACIAAGLKENEILWTSPNTFVASANCGLYCGSKVNFIDIDPNTYNLSSDELERRLIEAEKLGCLPQLLVPVHFAGQSCEMAKIYALSQKYNFKIIEDASHAIGGKYQHQPIGSCLFSDMTVFSFHPVKIITTGEGGMVLTNQEELYQRLMRLRSHGITRNPNFMQGESHGLWYYQQLELGYNYRMTDIQAALGTSQMQRLDEFVERRWFLANRYNQLLQDLPLILPWQHPDTQSSWHLYVIRLKLDKINKTHQQVFEELRQENIGVNLHYIPVHTQPYYQQLGFSWGDFPQVEKYYQKAISLPLYYSLTQEDQDRVVAALQRILL